MNGDKPRQSCGKKSIKSFPFYFSLSHSSLTRIYIFFFFSSWLFSFCLSFFFSLSIFCSFFFFTFFLYLANFKTTFLNVGIYTGKRGIQLSDTFSPVYMRGGDGENAVFQRQFCWKRSYKQIRTLYQRTLYMSYLVYCEENTIIRVWNYWHFVDIFTVFNNVEVTKVYFCFDI